VVVRNTVRALIVQNGMLLTIKKERPGIGIYYALPGGAQEPGETLEQALTRECLEELGIEIIDHQLLCIREYISNNHEYSFIMKEVHVIDFVFECSFISNESEMFSSQGDLGQIGIEWLPVAKIKQSICQPNELSTPYIFPNTTRDLLKEYFSKQSPEPYISQNFE